MREQILSGITAAVDNADFFRERALSELSAAEIDLIAEAVLAALAAAPESTPAPQPVTVQSQTMFTIDPAMVVAREAQRSLTTTEADPAYQVDIDALMDVQTYASESVAEARETREFLFAVQEMFGCKVRCVRNGDTERRFVIAGNVYQRNALLETLDALVDYASPLLSDLSSDERREFWATLGSMVSTTDDAEALIEHNRPSYAAACTAMVTTHGPARVLRRAEPATEGSIYDLAANAVPSAR
jgi:hypothetical protein